MAIFELRSQCAMATLLKNDCVFLHVPKTGGTFVRMYFKQMNLIRFDFARDHSDMERTLNTRKYYPGNYLKRSLQLRMPLEAKVGSSFKFCFVRNPFDWYISFWRYMQDYQWQAIAPINNRSRFGFRQDTWFPTTSLQQLGPLNFNDFLSRAIQKYPAFLSRLYDRYTTSNLIQFVGKTENLKADLGTVCEMTDIPFDGAVFDKLERVNISHCPSPSFSADLKKALYQSEKEAFEKYGYA